MSMVTFMATRIKEAYDKGTTLEEKVALGQAKYKAYFYGAARQKLYSKYEDDVDAILEQDDYGACIVPECRTSR